MWSRTRASDRMSGSLRGGSGQANRVSSTVIRSAGRGLGAGPATTEASVMRYLLPWQGQSIVPLATVLTVQP